MFVYDDSVLSLREKYLINEIKEFYTLDIVKNTLIPLLTQKAEISLRALDWLVTNYGKKYNVLCRSSLNNDKLINVFHSYKLALAHYKRKHFDPFRRRNRITFVFEDITYDTTIGQTNFIMWAYRLGVLDYAKKHSSEIEKDMNICTSQYRKERKENLRLGKIHKRKELSSAPASLCILYSTPTKVVFDIYDSE